MDKEEVSPFDAFKRHVSKKPKPKPAEKEVPSVPSEGANQDPGVPKKIDADPFAMIEKMNQMRKEFEAKLEDICRRSGMSLNDVRKELENPDNFVEEEYTFLNENRKNIQNYYEKKLKEASSLEPGSEKKKSPKKMLGQRKKWISM